MSSQKQKRFTFYKSSWQRRFENLRNFKLDFLQEQANVPERLERHASKTLQTN